MNGMIECREHGQSRRAYVCAHVSHTLSDGIPRGVIWSRDEDGCVNAYCDACDARLEAAGGEWIDEVVTAADIKLICEPCFRRTLSINEKTELN